MAATTSLQIAFSLRSLQRNNLKLSSFQSYSTTHSSGKVLPLNFFSSPLFHPPFQPAVYFLSPFSRGLSNAFPLPLSFSPERYISNNMILARCAGGVMWWFHCLACACLRCFSSTAVVPLSLSGALLLVWGLSSGPLAIHLSTSGL